MNPLETYLTELREIHDSGAATKETSGYPALAKLLDTAGHSLKPKVRCLIQLKNSGAGLPDGGLFTPDQLKNPDEQAPLFGLAPARGVIEVKSTSDELSAIAQTEQVKDYLSRYGQLLLTNYRDFLLLKRGPGGSRPTPRILPPRRKRSRLLGRRRPPAQDRRPPRRSASPNTSSASSSTPPRSTTRATSPSSSPPTPATPAPASSTPATSPPWPPSAPPSKKPSA